MSYQNQVEVCKAERKKQITDNADKIVKGKLKKLKEDDNEIQVVDRDSILDAEIAKISVLPRHMSLQQTFQAQPWMDYDFYQGYILVRLSIMAHPIGRLLIFEKN